MARYIDAQRLHNRVKIQTNPYGKPTLEYASGLKVLAMIDQEPTADVVEVKHGYWIEDGKYQICSECGEEHHWDDYRATYCEDCGARMDGKAQGEENLGKMQT